MTVKKLIKSCLIIFLFFHILACTTTNERPNRQSIEISLNEIETKTLPEIERLLNLCAQNRIAVDYEMVDYTIIKDFTGYIRDDLHHRDLERAAYGLRFLQEAGGNVINSLNSYLAGTARPLEVTRYVTSPVEIRGGSLFGRAVNPVTGRETTRPLFFTGYGHFDQIVKDMPKMTNYGVDILQTEIGPRHTVLEGYEINYSEIEKIENILREAEKNNIRVDVLLAPHYFPEWAFIRHPNLRENTGGFFTFNVYEPEAKKK